MVGWSTGCHLLVRYRRSIHGSSSTVALFFPVRVQSRRTSASVGVTTLADARRQRVLPARNDQTDPDYGTRRYRRWSHFDSDQELVWQRARLHLRTAYAVVYLVATHAITAQSLASNPRLWAVSVDKRRYRWLSYHLWKSRHLASHSWFQPSFEWRQDRHWCYHATLVSPSIDYVAVNGTRSVASVSTHLREWRSSTSIGVCFQSRLSPSDGTIYSIHRSRQHGSAESTVTYAHHLQGACSPC